MSARLVLHVQIVLADAGVGVPPLQPQVELLAAVALPLVVLPEVLVTETHSQ